MPGNVETGRYIYRALALVMGVLGLLSVLAVESEAGTSISLYATHAGHVNFVGTAGSLRRASNAGDACAVDNYDTANLTGLPAGATVRAAYLYWAGSWADNSGSTRRSPDWDITFEGVSLAAARRFTESYGAGFGRFDFFSGMADVTALVAAKGNGAYTFGNLSVNTGRPHCDSQAVLAGWSLIVVYRHGAESNRVVNIFDGFQSYRGGQIAVTANNFQISASDINGKVGHLTWEGDAENSGVLDGFGEGLIFNGAPLVDSLNPANNQFNSTVNVTGRADQWGVDLDIYDVTPFLRAGDTQATTVYRSGQDLVLLSAEIVSVTNIPLTDLGFRSQPGAPLGLYEPGTIALDLINHGPSDEPLPVEMTATLPAGFAYTGTVSSGWKLVASGPSTLTWRHPGTVAAGQVLPLVFRVLPGPVAVGTPSLGVTVSGGSFDFNLANNSGTVLLNVIVPPAELVSASFAQTVSDPLNGTVNPKAIPGATVVYTLTTSNLKAGAVDRNSITVTNPVPPFTALYVDDFPDSSDGPLLFVDGVPASGLSVRRGRNGGGSPDITYSDNGGKNFTYRPVPDGMGFDPAVTHFRVDLTGTLRGRDAAGPADFSLKFQVRLD